MAKNSCFGLQAGTRGTRAIIAWTPPHFRGCCPSLASPRSCSVIVDVNVGNVGLGDPDNSSMEATKQKPKNYLRSGLRVGAPPLSPLRHSRDSVWGYGRDSVVVGVRIGVVLPLGVG